MWVVSFQPGPLGTTLAVSSAPKLSHSRHEFNGGFPPRCCCPAFSFPTERRKAGRRENATRRVSSAQSPAYHMPLALLSWATVRLKRRSKQGSLTCMAALGLEVTPATVIVLSTVLGFAALRTYIYFRMEYIIAAMVGRHVPRGGAKVVELNTRGGKNLYYYPADIAQVVAVSSIPDVQVLESQATRAGVPVQIKTDGPTSLGVPSGSMDAVVSIFCLRDTADNEILNVLREAVRVLKPGKPFIFVETAKAKGGLFNLLGTNRAVINDLRLYLKEVGFEEVDCEEVLTVVDPHLVGIAKKKLSVVSEPNKDVRKGFKSSKTRQK